MRFEKPIKGCADDAFLTLEVFRAQRNFQFSDIYIYICIIMIDIVFFCMNCTNLTNACPKFPRASHRPSSGMPKRIPEFGPVRSKTSHSISGFTFVHHASELDISVFGGLVCDENMYSSFFFLVKNRAKPHILMKRFKIELIYSSWTKCGVSTRW